MSITVRSFEEFKQYEGQELGVSEYLQITQEQINKFADATLDDQWIHTQPERAEKESAFGTTIAHGYLTLSLVPHLWNQILQAENLKMMVNYGVEKLRFAQPVKVNDRVRLKASLHSIANLRGVVKIEVDVKLEIEGQRKPAYSGILVLLYHFND
ncbi:MaoC family dehydratase [Algivirga pacifica]|uniref:MaoC family dehydratase n=1 Tax=Algivirga pacifica TaxID=1162670 RepID=A0ABP9D7I9_9BACT